MARPGVRHVPCARVADPGRCRTSSHLPSTPNPAPDTLRPNDPPSDEGTSMALPQTGIFALGTPAHSYLEMRLRPEVDQREAVAAATGLSEPRTTMGGV